MFCKGYVKNASYVLIGLTLAATALYFAKFSRQNAVLAAAKVCFSTRFCLPPTQKAPRGTRSRTKSLKIEKMFCRFPSAISPIRNIPLTTTTRSIRATPIPRKKNRSTLRHCGFSINFQISTLSQAPNFLLAKAWHSLAPSPASSWKLCN